MGFERRTWYLASGNALAADAPTDATTSDTYTVDFSASTGEKNRWRTQAQGDDVVYSDRTQQDAKLLVYTSAPLESNLEITGSPIVTFYASSTADDGAFFAYLECVDAARRVTYLTEGMLHARDRKVSTAEPPYAVFGPYHTHKRADGAPLVPGEITEYTFELIPTSVTLKKGDRIRIALAGHDASCFQRYPASGLPVLTVYRDAAHQSRIELPVR